MAFWKRKKRMNGLPVRYAVTGKRDTKRPTSVGLLGIVIDGFPVAMGKTTLSQEVLGLFKLQYSTDGMIGADMEDVIISGNASTQGNAAMLDTTNTTEWLDVAGKENGMVKTNAVYYFEKLLNTYSGNHPHSPNYHVESTIAKQAALNGAYISTASAAIHTALLDTSEKPQAVACVFSRDVETSAVEFLVAELLLAARMKQPGIVYSNNVLEHIYNAARVSMVRFMEIDTPYGTIENTLCIDLEDILTLYCFDDNLILFLEWCYQNMVKRNRYHERLFYASKELFIDFFSLGDNYKYNWLIGHLREHRTCKYQTVIKADNLPDLAEEWLLHNIKDSQESFIRVAKSLIANKVRPTRNFFTDLERGSLFKFIAKLANDILINGDNYFNKN